MDVDRVVAPGPLTSTESRGPSTRSAESALIRGRWLNALNLCDGMAAAGEVGVEVEVEAA